MLPYILYHNMVIIVYNHIRYDHISNLHIYLQSFLFMYGTMLYYMMGIRQRAIMLQVHYLTTTFSAVSYYTPRVQLGGSILEGYSFPYLVWDGGCFSHS